MSIPIQEPLSGRTDEVMTAYHWVVTGWVILEGGWTVFDGTRALTVGDYVTPREGPDAGQLGPWSGVVESAGLDPRSNAVKVAFIAYGGLYFGALAAFNLGWSWGWWSMVAVAVLGLWHLPVGTAINLIVIGLLLFSPLRGGG